jgi:integrase/recombinase XerD
VKLELGSPPEEGDPYEAFITALQVTGAGKGTVKLYSTAVKEFLDFVGKDPRKVNSDDVNKWVLSLAKRANPTTVRYYVIAVRGFLKWLGVNVRPALPRAKRKEVRALNEEQIKLLVSSARNLKTRLIVRLLSETGMRANELLNVRVEDVDLERNMIRLRMTKNGEERVVFFTDETKTLLEKYLKRVNSGLLFPMTYQALYKTIRRLGERIGINGLRPHMLRHSFATNAIRKGMPLPAVQRLLGHKDIKTTQIYTHLVLEDLQEAYKKAFSS